MSVTQPTLTLTPHIKASASFTIRVPSSATPGDHLGGIGIQPALATTSAGALHITVINRFVIATLVVIPGNSSLNFDLPNATIGTLAATHAASVTVTLSNTGNLLGKLRMTVTLKGTNGYYKTSTLPLDTVLPGDTIAYPFRWPYAIPAGQYRIVVTARWFSNSHQENVTRTFGYTLGSALKPTVSNVVYVPQKETVTPGWVLVLVIIGGLIIIASVLVIVLLVRRQRHFAAQMAQLSRDKS